MLSKSIKGKTTQEIKEALEANISSGFTPTIAIVFISVAQDRMAITTLLNDNNITVFGCTTNGEFIDEETETESVAILLMDMKPEHFKIYLEEYPNNNYREVAITVAKKSKTEFTNPIFLIGLSNNNVDGEEILHGFEDVIGTQVNVFGGVAGDDMTFIESFVFTNYKESKCGLMCLALDGDHIDIQGVATCGWKAMGTEKTVTRSEGNHVFTVDDVPVLDLTVKYGGLENVTPDNQNLLLEIAANFPLQLQREKGDPIMRPGLVVDWKDGSFYTSGTVPQGSKVRFSLPPDFDVMEKVVKGVENLKASKMPEAEALVIFSCAGRLMSFGPMMAEEIGGVKNIWNVPLVGMFSNGELARATGGNLEMHNLTTCCVALKEK